MDTLLNDVDYATAYIGGILIKNESRKPHAEHIKEAIEKNKVKWLENLFGGL